MTIIIDARNGRYNENGTISAEVQFSGGDKYLPYTAAAHDPTDYGQQLYSELVAGKYGEVTPFTVTEKMLGSARQRKRDEINAWRDTQEDKEYLMTWNGRRWDFGKKTQARMATSVTMASRNTLPDGFAWTDGDNNIVPVTAEELLALAGAIENAMFEKGMQINQRQLQMKAEVNALVVLDAIRNYRVGWNKSVEDIIRTG
ncbi:TPA: DUF4376 domain-containing protein [Escherichia coli]|nr:DUF4376 domain-containing protein [Escherichia coli]